MRSIDSIFEAIITAFIVLLSGILVIGLTYLLKLFKKKSLKKSQVKRQQKHNFLIKACRQKERISKSASCPNSEPISCLKQEECGTLTKLPNNNNDTDEPNFTVEGIPLIHYNGFRKK